MKRTFNTNTVLITVLLTAAVAVMMFPACTSTPETPNKNDDDVWTLLSNGDEKAKGFFLGEVDVHAKDSRGRTPLHYAAEQNDAGLTAFFIALGADVNARDNSKQTPLGICVEKKSDKAARVIANAGADIHLGAYNGISPAVMTVTRKNNILEEILNPASLASTDAGGRTVLHIACDTGNVDAVKIILEAIDSAEGAGKVPVAAGNRNNPIDKRDFAGKNPLDLAYDHPDSIKHIETAEQLILSEAVSDNPIHYYLAPAVRNANYNLRRNDGLAPLHFAAGEGYEGLISFLIEKNANINIQTQSGSTPLHEAVRSGNINAVRLILKGGADINAQDAKGNSPLHIAVPPKNHTEMIRLLLSNGAKANLRDEHGDSPLHVLVILNRSPDTVRALFSGGAANNVDASIRNIKGQTPLYIAVQEQRTALIPLLLSAGSDVFAADNSGVTPFNITMHAKGPVLDAIITDATVQQKDSAGNTMLHAAIRNSSDTAIIAKIIDKNANVNARNRDGDTPLHIAVRTNQKETGEYIIAEGADIFSSNSSGESPLYLSLTQSSGVVQWLFNSQTITAHDGLENTMLHYVALWKMDKHIPFIIEKGISTEVKNATGETPLFWAVKYDGDSTVRTLLSEKANLQARDILGNSALHAAVCWNAKNAVNTLLDSGINVNVHNLNGTTPLHDSVRLGINDIAGILINRGANLEVRDSGGNTPFMEAVKAGYASSADLLAKRGAFTMTRNTNGDTPLHYAVSREDDACIKLLLNLGVSIHARNTRNRTPFQIALTESPGTLPVLLTGERINGPDDFGNSPLHIALQEKVPVSVLKTIVDKGSHLTAVDSNGRIPLRVAVDMNAWDSAKLLADSGSDPFSTAVDDKTTGEIAIGRGNDAIRYIFSGSAINAKDPSGNTVLHYAARIGKPDSISLLLELGANKSVKNIAAESPADIAARWNNRENASLLN